MSPDLKHRARLVGILLFAAVLLANLVALLAAIGTSGEFVFSGPEETTRFEVVLDRDLVSLILTFAAFPLVVIRIFLYLRPIFRVVSGRAPTGSEAQRSGQRRTLTLPLIYSLTSFVAWVGTLALVHVRVYTLILFNLVQALRTWAFFLLWAAFAFVLTYAITDLITRQFLVPWAFPQGDVSSVRVRHRVLSISERYFINWVSLFLFPTGLFVLLLTAQDLSPDTLGLVFTSWAGLVGLTLLLTWLLERSYRVPLVEMQSLVQALDRADYGQRIPVRTADELGILAEALN